METRIWTEDSHFWMEKKIHKPGKKEKVLQQAIQKDIGF